MNEKVSVDMLTSESVSLKKQNYITADGIEYSVSQPLRKAYVNNTSGRAEVESEVAEPYKTAILAVWGDSPTVDDVNVD